MVKRDYDWFEEKGEHFAKLPQIKISENGSFHILASFYKKYPKTKECTYISVGFRNEEEAYVIGFFFSSDPNRPGALKIYNPKKISGAISCLSFFKKHGLDLKKIKGLYTAKDEETDKGTVYQIKVHKS